MLEAAAADRVPALRSRLECSVRGWRRSEIEGSLACAPPPNMVDWDTTLAYKTVKFARVLDWRLGALHYFFQFLVGVYIVAYTLLLKKEYLRTETPAGV